MTDTADVLYESETDEVTFTLPNGVFAVFPGEGIVSLAKEIKKTRKKAKKNVETKTLTQTLVPVKFKKMKAGKRYRIEETSGVVSEVIPATKPEFDGANWYIYDDQGIEFYKNTTLSVYLIETSEIS